MAKDYLPPYFSTGDRNSFAMRTIEKRKPAILDQVVDANEFSRCQREALLSLKNELMHGEIIDPFTDPDFRIDTMDEQSLGMWKRVVPQYRGRSWLNLPFYFAEAFFYTRVLIAIGYFDPESTYYLKDPYQPFKNRELLSKDGGLEIGRILVDSLEKLRDPRERIIAILYNSLWGNRVDLSLFTIAEQSRDRVLNEGAKNLLIDHSKELSALIDKSERIDFILDNTGQEIVCDLFAVWHILSSSPRKKVYLHAKRYPFYVSDAMIKDVEATIAALRRDENAILSRIGRDIESFGHKERCILQDHFFWNGPLHYPDLPDDLFHELSRSDVILLKGDINYRRIVSDRRWKISKNLEDIARYFPTNFALLRTMKSEAVVDIDEERAAMLEKIDPEWMVNGERGMIRVVERKKELRNR